MHKDSVNTVINNAKVIFWDFDGVIKDSVPVKTEAFRKLFLPFGIDAANKAVAHHLCNGGVSRFEKIPYYFKHFVGDEISSEQSEQYCSEYSKLVVDKVVSSPWIDGVERYLRQNPKHQTFVLVTGTPTDEISSILERLKLEGTFLSVHGSPENKSDAVAKDIANNDWIPTDCVLIGDSSTDYIAARENGIRFLYRGAAGAVPASIKPDYVIDDFSRVSVHV